MSASWKTICHKQMMYIWKMTDNTTANIFWLCRSHLVIFYIFHVCHQDKHCKSFALKLLELLLLSISVCMLSYTWQSITGTSAYTSLGLISIFAIFTPLCKINFPFIQVKERLFSFFKEWNSYHHCFHPNRTNSANKKYKDDVFYQPRVCTYLDTAQLYIKPIGLDTWAFYC